VRALPALAGLIAAAWPGLSLATADTFWAACGTAGSALGIQPAGRASSIEEPDDRLSAEDERLVRELTERNMPELVRELLTGRPAAQRIYVARAYAHAAIEERNPRLRERFFRAAAREYRRMLALAADPDWLRGLRRRVDGVQWRVEWADLILRHWIAPDLDRFEITSGLDYNRPRLAALLREAHALYAQGQRAADELLMGLRTEEERYLLLGLSERVTTLVQHRRLNCGWAGLYLAMVGEEDAEARSRLFEAALADFDAVARADVDAALRHNALLGAAVALRESGRHAEADLAFERLLNDPQVGPELRTRARFEKARLLMAEARFAAARRELEAVAGIGREADEAQGDEGAGFYVRLAPLIHAYTFILEAGQPRVDQEVRGRLQAQATEGFTRLARQGGVWPDLVKVYLDVLAGGRRGLADLTSTELRLTGNRLMSEKNYVEALAAWKALLDRPEGRELHAEARFNFGVCAFHTKDLRAAAEAFLEVARGEGREAFHGRAAEYAYRAWRQLARDSRSADDYRRLAEAAEQVGRRLPDSDLLHEAVYVAGLARQEAGDYEAAIAAHQRAAPSSPHYWESRRALARCRQRLAETLPPEASGERRGRLAQSASAEWLRLADDLSAAKLVRDPGGKAAAVVPGVGDSAERDRWVLDARLSAAAVLAKDDVRLYDSALEILRPLPLSGRAVALRIQCHRGRNDPAAARRVLEEYLSTVSGDDAGPALLALAAETESEVLRLRDAGRLREAAQLAESSLPTMRQLAQWIEEQPRYARHAATVRFSLARALALAGKREEALALLRQLMDDDPAAGHYVLAAARTMEEAAADAPNRSDLADQAEALWAQLLKDADLRERAPAEYWEARYHWLRHQLRHGRGGEVVRGIESERAWQPDLGGPPWQQRLLRLAEEARSRADPSGPGGNGAAQEPTPPSTATAAS